MRTPGPNDFHMENGVLLPGLGADEPSELTFAQVKADAEANEQRQAALDRAAAALSDESAILDRKIQALEEREAELARREKALLSAAQAEESAPRRTARQATERVPA